MTNPKSNDSPTPAVSKILPLETTLLFPFVSPNLFSQLATISRLLFAGLFQITAACCNGKFFKSNAKHFVSL